MIFHNKEFFWLFLLVAILYFLIQNKKSIIENIFDKSMLKKMLFKKQGLSYKTRMNIMLLGMVFFIIALARPQILNKEIKISSSFNNVVVAIDMSKSMFAKDIYPNRFEFAKRKFFNLLDLFKNAKIALLGFSSQTFLISPLTQDFYSLKYLTKNLSFDYLNLKGTDILSVLKAANSLFQDEKKKALLIFSDGGDKKDFSKEIAFAKTHGISVYIYNTATKKGGVIKTKNGVLKDKNNNIVITKRNEFIKELALKSGGAYMDYSLKKDDIKLLIEAIKSHFKTKKESDKLIKDYKELFVYPLFVGIVLLFISFFSIPSFRGRK